MPPALGECISLRKLTTSPGAARRALGCLNKTTGPLVAGPCRRGCGWLVRLWRGLRPCLAPGRSSPGGRKAARS